MRIRASLTSTRSPRISGFRDLAGGDKVQRPGDNVRFVFPSDIASNARVAVALLFLSILNTAAFGASECDQESTLGASHIRRALASQNSVNHSPVEECRVVISQFVEAVTARQAAATCQNSVSRERALRIIDAEIETFNDLCVPKTLSELLT
jgi:hypothetical protein